jgi:mannose-6-phosphate isomerase-like protein (cupin superfamily)
LITWSRLSQKGHWYGHDTGGSTIAKLQNSNEIDHDAAEAAVQTFSFKAPETHAKRKAIVRLTSNDRGQTAVHCLGQGGENNLHYHAGVDITWMVLKGRARFYGSRDVVRGEFGPQEGILIPAGARYWFESCGSDDMELLQIKMFHKGRGQDKRVDAAARHFEMAEGAGHFSAEKPAQ